MPCSSFRWKIKPEPLGLVDMIRGAVQKFLLVFTLTLFVPVTYQIIRASCEQCMKNKADMLATSGRIDRVKDILQKNQDYVTRNPNAQASIVIKVRSNILMAKVQIETMTNQLTAFELAGQKLECSQCR